MKRLIKSKSLTNSKILLTIFLFLSLMISMTSCEDSMDDNLSDSTLIEQIKNSDLEQNRFIKEETILGFSTKNKVVFGLRCI
ncbi:MAG: hypothetical protein HN591_06690 [Flavobacteriales bacterium]|nr:hypothetical protein [Flavobacteriales bacterium]